MAESDLKEDMAEALWSCFRRRNMGKLQIALYNPNVTPDMLLPPDTQAENPCCNERKNIPCWTGLVTICLMIEYPFSCSQWGNRGFRDPVLRSEIYERENEEVLPSAILIVCGILRMHLLSVVPICKPRLTAMKMLWRIQDEILMQILRMRDP